MSKIQKAALLYMFTLAIFAYGYSVARFRVPPAAFLEARIQDIQAFIAGDALDRDTSIVDKIQSDAGFAPKRFLGEPPGSMEISHHPLVIPDLKDRRTPPGMYLEDEEMAGYRVVIGAMDFNETFWGAVLISPQGKAIHTWNLSTRDMPGNTLPDTRKVLYGSHIGSDGSIIFSMQEHGGGLVKVDVCSNEIWNLPGSYHHTVAVDDNGAFWSFVGKQSTFDQDLVKVSVETGERLDTVHMAEVRRLNDGAYIWNLRNPIFADWKVIKASDHMTHGNDIDPLPEELAPAFPQFDAGDLLISYASLNLVFILDPDTLEVKWWRVGATDYQHDPDWEPDGHIAIFNNKTRSLNYGEGYSEIVSIDTDSYESEVIYRGENPLFRSLFNGRHELTDYGTRMVTSSNQGWAFEIDDKGEIVFSFINKYDKNKALFLSNAVRLPTDYFDGKPWLNCEQHT